MDERISAWQKNMTTRLRAMNKVLIEKLEDVREGKELTGRSTLTVGISAVRPVLRHMTSPLAPVPPCSYARAIFVTKYLSLHASKVWRSNSLNAEKCRYFRVLTGLPFVAALGRIGQLNNCQFIT